MPVTNAATANTTRTMVTSRSKYSARPAHTPASFSLSRRRRSGRGSPATRAPQTGQKRASAGTSLKHRWHFWTTAAIVHLPIHSTRATPRRFSVSRLDRGAAVADIDLRTSGTEERVARDGEERDCGRGNDSSQRLPRRLATCRLHTITTRAAPHGSPRRADRRTHRLRRRTEFGAPQRTRDLRRLAPACFDVSELSTGPAATLSHRRRSGRASPREAPGARRGRTRGIVPWA